MKTRPTSELDNIYCGTGVEFEWSEPKQQGKSFHQSMLNELIGTIEHDGTVIAEVSDIQLGSISIDGEFTGVAFHDRIFCTYNNYKSNKKALIL